MRYVNFNGSVHDEDSPLLYSWNRAFRYGDGFFETIAVVDGKIPLLNDHWKRLTATSQAIQFLLPDFFSKEYLREKILDVCRLNKSAAAACPEMELFGAAARVQIFRGGKGKYTPETNEANFLIETDVLPYKPFQLNENGLTVGVFEKTKKAADEISNLKTCSALIFVLAAAFKNKNNWDDCILLNTNGNVCEATSSNIFIVKDGKIFTPSLSEGCVAGVMRKNILKIAKDTVGEIRETAVAPAAFKEADEIFLTNAVAGIRWVRELEGEKKENKIVVQLQRELEKTLSNNGEESD